MTVPHIPALRRGRAYETLDQSTIVDGRSGQVLATLSQVNAGVIRVSAGLDNPHNQSNLQILSLKNTLRLFTALRGKKSG